MTVFESIWVDILRTSWIEWCAVLTGILYVILVSRKMMLCWLFAIISSSLYVYLLINVQLYIESMLQIFYVAMAFYGWLMWQKDNASEQVSDKNDDNLIDNLFEKQDGNDVKTWSLKSHLINIVASGVVAFIVGYLFKEYTDQQNPYTDAFTTVFSLAATFMVTQKVLENWLYWIVIDAVSIYLYSTRGFHLSAGLYFVYTILAVLGFISWYKHFKRYRA